MFLYELESHGDKRISEAPLLLTVIEIKLGDNQDDHCFSLVTPTSTIHFKAESKQEMSHWINFFTKVSRLNKLKLLSQKKNDESNTVHVNDKLYSPQEYKKLIQISNAPGNNICADCSSTTTGWASINLGIFICLECSGIHRNLGIKISKVRSLELDVWPTETIDFMGANGNLKSNKKYEFLKTTASKVKPSPDALRSLKEQFIQMKYVNKAFSKKQKNTKDKGSILDYQTKLFFEGELLKRKGDSNNWKSYWFVLKGKTFSFYKQREHPEPIGCISLTYANLKSSSLDNVNTFEVESEGTTHYFQASDSSSFFSWTESLRAALKKTTTKSKKSNIADLGYQECCFEGWLYKEGGSIKTWKRRWCILRENKLSYYSDADAKDLKGSIALSMSIAKESIESEHRHKKIPDPTYTFFFEVVTPKRVYVFSDSSQDGRDQWISSIKKSMELYRKIKDDSVKAVAYINQKQ